MSYEQGQSFSGSAYVRPEADAIEISGDSVPGLREECTRSNARLSGQPRHHNAIGIAGVD